MTEAAESDHEMVAGLLVAGGIVAGVHCSCEWLWLVTIIVLLPNSGRKVLVMMAKRQVPWLLTINLQVPTQAQSVDLDD